MERKKATEDMKRAFENPRGVQVDKVEKLLNALNTTYTRPAYEVPRLLLWDPQLALTRVYAMQKDMAMCLASAGKVLTSLGFIIVGADSSAASFAVVKWGLIVDHLMETFLHLKAAFSAIRADKDSKYADECARLAYKIVVGEDASFDTLYGNSRD
ncbi:hypothetical protein LTS18_011814 [Coniosporium uncinatum]|uniref:Uncharacterized protein n=1 Tax=Coniosporium uncinatum TaxID=93489 RepID=A0ACC3D9H4_9PEZI|nr:hypothetical protein LTS18_011814 [Coniosporium uncinatum]